MHSGLAHQFDIWIFFLSLAGDFKGFSTNPACTACGDLASQCCTCRVLMSHVDFQHFFCPYKAVPDDFSFTNMLKDCGQFRCSVASVLH